MNYYEILKVSKTASDEEIKDSYKKLVKKYHPDLYVGDKDFAEKKLKEINEAYDILSNPETKAEYDEYLNPKPEITYTNTTYNPSYVKTDDSTNNTSQENNFSFTQFLTEKFNLLDKKRQLQIFIIILISILALFLINLIQAKHYLNNQNDIHNNNEDYITEYEDEYYNEDDDYYLDVDELDDNDYYTQSFNDFLNYLYESYEENFGYTNNTE